MAKESAAKQVALGFSGISVLDVPTLFGVYSTTLMPVCNSSNGISGLPLPAVHYALGIDGISMPLVLLDDLPYATVYSGVLVGD